MSYAVTNFKTKKELSQAVKWWNDFNRHREALGDGFEASATDASPVRCYNPGLDPDLSGYTGKVYLEGPHYPAPHSWYAEVELKDGIVIKVK